MTRKHRINLIWTEIRSDQVIVANFDVSETWNAERQMENRKQ